MNDAQTQSPSITGTDDIFGISDFDETRGTTATPGAPGSRPEERRLALPALGTNEFQDYVEISIGRRLPLFGYDLFRSVPSTFAPVERTPVSGEYVIGPGDQILIRAWGQIDINYRATVDRNGSIYLPKVGEVTVSGVRYSQLTELLRTAIGRLYRNFDLNVTMGQLRSVQVFVMGQARRPGNYTVSSLSTLVNTIFASGGPSITGSMRDIQLKRNGQVVARFDMYDLLLKGDKSKDSQLQPGDVIYIPPIGKLAAIAGSVNTPAIFEIKEGETLGDLIKFAGGLAVTAAGQRVTLERVVERKTRQMAEFQLDPGGMQKPLQDGDLVNVFPLSRRFDNAVTLRGNVAVPGRFPWHEGMRIKDLIPDRQSLITPEFWRRQTGAIMLGNPAESSPQLRNRSYDERLRGEGAANTTAPSPGTPVTPAADQAAQAQNQPAEDTSKNRTTGGLQAGARNLGNEALRSEVRSNAPDINWDYAVIERLDEATLTTSLIPFNLEKAIGGDPDNNLPLQAGDVITVFSQRDIRVPLQKQSKYVRLEGEVGASGVYQIKPGETLRQLVRRIGGLTSNAYLFGAQFTRESTRIEQQKKLDDLANRLERDAERSTAIHATDPEDVAGIGAKVDSQRRLVASLRETKAIGRIVLNIKPDQQGVDALPDLSLEDGDRLYVPYKPATVSVLGAVYNENDLLFRPGGKVSDYLRAAGGATRDADKSHIYIVRADGSIQGSGTGSSLLSSGITSERLQPGDTVIVPENFNKTTLVRNLKDYTQILSQFALGVAAINVLRQQ